MKNTSTTIVFFGNERLATGVSTTAPTLQALIENGYTVAAAVANYEVGRSRNARNLEIASVTQAHHIPLLLPDKPGDSIEALAALHADIGILVAYGKIVPQTVIDIFPQGIINIHPSLLPRHRGPTPIESVLLNGEAETGVSIMQLVKAMDAGPVYGQSTLPLNGHETKQELADKLLDLGSTMLLSLLPGILDGQVVAMPQDDSAATYDQLLSKNAGVIDWQKPAELIEREIRAYALWPKSRTVLAGKDIEIISAKVHPQTGTPGTVLVDNNQLIICTAKASLEIKKLKPAGKNEMTAEAFLAGHRSVR